jgi:V8-like Glu-specific endopeptidase
LVKRLAALAGAAAVLASLVLVFGIHVGSATKAPAPAAGAGRVPAVGALFARTSGGKLGRHFCTASVVDSPSGDLILTAAHCMTGRSAGDMAFVPDFDSGHEPFGIWTITRVIVDQDWQSSANPDDDFAFLVVSQPGTSARLQSLTGAEAIGIGEAAGGLVTVAGYPDDLDTQISCRSNVLPFGAAQLEFDCGGYTDGTSGGPFLAGVSSPGGSATVIGVIGGYQQGGYTPSVSYAARFGAHMAALYQTAIASSGSPG